MQLFALFGCRSSVVIVILGKVFVDIIVELLFCFDNAALGITLVSGKGKSGLKSYESY